VETIVLVQRDKPDSLENYACGKCHVFYAGERAEADACCAPRACACGAVIEERYYSACAACRAITESTREAEEFAKATKVTYAEYDEEVVFWDGHGSGDMGGDGFWSSLETVLEHCDQEELARPMFVWGVSRTYLSLDARSILESNLESQEFYEDAYDNIPGPEIEALDAYLKALCDRLKLHVFFPAGVAVLVPPRTEGEEPDMPERLDGETGAQDAETVSQTESAQ